MFDQKKIISMFNDIAKRYDVASEIVSFGADSTWKSKSIQRTLGYLNTDKDIKILDIACGTGSMIEKFRDILDKNRICDYKIYGVDPSSKMIEIAKSKFNDIDFFETKADKMPFEDKSMDLISIAYGVRNMINIQSSLDEIYRVLDDDGVLLILEFFKDSDSTSYINYAKNLYIKHMVPLIGGVVSKNKESFEYLASSIEAFGTTKEFQDKLESSGFEIIYIRGFMFDVAHCMIITKSKEKQPKEKITPKKLTPKKSSISKEQLPYYRALKTVTMKCFVSYYEYFAKENMSNKEITQIMQKDSNYTKDSCCSRISNARFIVNNGYAKEALEYILKANRVDESTRRKAKKILKNNFS